MLRLETILTVSITNWAGELRIYFRAGNEGSNSLRREWITYIIGVKTNRLRSSFRARPKGDALLGNLLQHMYPAISTGLNTDE
jgi:hypothetical protein